jgi:hypothetical protein
VRKPTFQQAAAALSTCPPEVILRAAALCDGHTILDPKAFLDAGLPVALVEHLSHTHSSDGTPKGTIFVDGQPVPEVQGVYGLDLLRFIASALDVDYPSCLGRGFQASAIRESLCRHFADRPTSTAPERSPS